MASSAKYLTVTDVNNRIHQMFAHNYNLKSVHMTGEISNYRPRPWHQYFTLKDDNSHISAIIWGSQFKKIKFRLKNGMKVNVVGTISTYPKNGEYQIYIWHIEPNGVGQLYVRLKQMQMALAKQGLFSPAHKRPLVQFPKRIAVITSPSGAVIRDIIKTVRARYPIAQIILYPAQVQGQRSVDSLVQRLRQVSINHDCDEVIIGRGGGSLEDLWGFESADLARAIYNCSIPVVSSVGHGTDQTTADLVADKSVVTPTAAGEVCTPVILTDEISQLKDYRQRLLDACQQKLADCEHAVADVCNSAVFQHPERIYDLDAQKVINLRQQLISQLNNRIGHQQNRVDNLLYLLRSNSPQQMIENHSQTIKLYRTALAQNMKLLIQHKKSTFKELVSSLNELSPLRRMAQGYSVVTDQNHHLVRSARALKSGAVVHLQFRDGHRNARVLPRKRPKQTSLFR